MTEEDLLRALLPGAISLSAMLITVLVFLLTQYQLVKRSKDLSKPYKRLSQYASVPIMLSIISAFASTLYLLFSISPNSPFYVLYPVAVCSLLLALVSLVLVVALLLRNVIK